MFEGRRGELVQYVGASMQERARDGSSFPVPREISAWWRNDLGSLALDIEKIRIGVVAGQPSEGLSISLLGALHIEHEADGARSGAQAGIDFLCSEQGEEERRSIDLLNDGVDGGDELVDFHLARDLEHQTIEEADDAALSKPRKDREPAYLGDRRASLTHRRNFAAVDALDREAEGAIADERHGADSLSVGDRDERLSRRK